jgi:hypothetical protein
MLILMFILLFFIGSEHQSTGSKQNSKGNWPSKKKQFF